MWPGITLCALCKPTPSSRRRLSSLSGLVLKQRHDKPGCPIERVGIWTSRLLIHPSLAVSQRRVSFERHQGHASVSFRSERSPDSPFKVFLLARGLLRARHDWLLLLSSDVSYVQERILISQQLDPCRWLLILCALCFVCSFVQLIRVCSSTHTSAAVRCRSS